MTKFTLELAKVIELLQEAMRSSYNQVKATREKGEFSQITLHGIRNMVLTFPSLGKKMTDFLDKEEIEMAEELSRLERIFKNLNDGNTRESYEEIKRSIIEWVDLMEFGNMGCDGDDVIDILDEMAGIPKSKPSRIISKKSSIHDDDDDDDE